MNSASKCEIVQEISYMPGGPNGWEKLLRQALKHPNIKGWAYIQHDKDIDDQGNPIAPHVHIVIILHDSVKYSTIGGYIGVPAQYVQSIKQRIRKGKHYQSDVGGALSYLTHRNAKDKHQYDDSEVVAKPGFNWRGLRAESERAQAEQRSLNQIYKDIETGKIREFDLFKHISMGAYGLTVRLCHECHNEPPHGVHHSAKNQKKLQRRVQRVAMRHYGWSLNEFRTIFGKNYL